MIQKSPVIGILRIWAFLSISLFSGGAWSAGPCDQPQSEAAVSQCLAIELQNVYSKLSMAYRNQIAAASAIQEAEFRDSESSWEKRRNTKCEVDIQGPNISDLLHALAANPRKVTCVIRETREHLKQFEKSRILAAEPASAKIPVSKPVTAMADFHWISPVTRSSGKWYFEVTLDKRSIARTQEVLGVSWPMAIWIGCSDTKGTYDIGTLVEIRAGSAQISETLGFALDLDRGKLFVSRNGSWQNGNPGSSGGKAIRQGLAYICALDSTVAIWPLLNKKIVNVNLGDEPFRFSLPREFRPFHKGFLWALGAISSDRRLYFDYRQLLEDPKSAIAFVKEEFLAVRDSGEGIPGHTSRIAQLDVACPAEQLTERTLSLYGKDGTQVAFINKPREVDHVPGLDTIGGRFARTLCFLQQQGVAVPHLSLKDVWDEMQSPAPGIKIFEAVDQRQYRNGYLLAKQLNESDMPVSVFGKESRKLVSVSAFNCKDLTPTQLVSLRYGEHGAPIGIDFFMSQGPLRLEKNKQRFALACSFMSRQPSP